jgi:glyoxylase-like metal-dependent hydrolase (beta-lactamase superfamily II)
MSSDPQSLTIGSIELALVSDGQDRVPPDMILAGAPADEISSVCAGQLDHDGQLPVAYNALLIRSAGRQILVDAGHGELSEDERAGGALEANLAARGVEPESIDTIVISHAHADHVGGLVTTVDDQIVPTYPRATHYINADEWTHWTSPASLAAMPQRMADPARRCLPPLAAAGLVELVDAERAVAPGVTMISAAGHTPGHAVVRVESRGASAIFIADCVFHPVNFLAPNWPCIFDVDPHLAVKSRRRMLEQAATDDSVVLATHVSTPGRVERTRQAYRFITVGG